MVIALPVHTTRLHLNTSLAVATMVSASSRVPTTYRSMSWPGSTSRTTAPTTAPPASTTLPGNSRMT